ncbi:uncharacterized protein METZ01_LOCUS440638, partial [marine metagenome]
VALMQSAGGPKSACRYQAATHRLRLHGQY